MSLKFLQNSTIQTGYRREYLSAITSPLPFGLCTFLLDVGGYELMFDRSKNLEGIAKVDWAVHESRIMNMAQAKEKMKILVKPITPRQAYAYPKKLFTELPRVTVTKMWGYYCLGMRT
jgi:hypothetical protein